MPEHVYGMHVLIKQILVWLMLHDTFNHSLDINYHQYVIVVSNTAPMLCGILLIADDIAIHVSSHECLRDHVVRMYVYPRWPTLVPRRYK